LRSIVEISNPPKPNPQVLIKVEPGAYNHNDLWGIGGKPIKLPMPHISGSDLPAEDISTKLKVEKKK
jgi:alcohol dehydrogenase